MTKEDVDDLKTIREKYNTQPIYLVISYNLSTVSSVVEMIRKIDYSNTIIAFTHSSNTIFNTYFVSPTVRDTKELALSEVCMFCNKGQDVIEKTNTWREQTGFTSPFSLAKSFKGQFFGAKVRYYCHDWGPWLNLQIGNFDYLEKSLNFKTDIWIRSPYDIQNLISTNQVHLGGCAHTMSHARYQYADFSYIYADYGLKNYSMKPERGLTWYSFVMAYQPSCLGFLSRDIPNESPGKITGNSRPESREILCHYPGINGIFLRYKFNLHHGSHNH